MDTTKQSQTRRKRQKLEDKERAGNTQEVGNNSEEEKKADDTGEEADDYDVIIVGAGAAGIGMAVALKAAYVDSSKVLVLEKGPSIGTSFRSWHKFTRFISPSWPSTPYGVQDLNSVFPDTTIGGGSQHPTGDEYADYLEDIAKGFPINLRFRSKVTKIEHHDDDSDDKNQFSVHVDGRETPYTSLCVVWCGGEWSNPTSFPNDVHDGCDFQDNCTVHYRDFDIDEIEHSSNVGNDNESVIVVGYGEAGADTAVALAERGISVVIVDGKNPDAPPSKDPSCRLSPKSTTELSRYRDKITILQGHVCVGVASSPVETHPKPSTPRIEVTLADCQTGEVTKKLTTRSKVVLCTGFDISKDPVIKDLFHWRDDGYPEVTMDCDESTKTPNLFLSGPMLRHTIDSCSVDNGCQTAVFCFVYKFRTRFVIIASEIVYRIIHERYAEAIDASGNVSLSREGQMWGASIESVREHYKSKGMMLSEITEACGNCGG